jgi:endonuclease G
MPVARVTPAEMTRLAVLSAAMALFPRSASADSACRLLFAGGIMPLSAARLPGERSLVCHAAYAVLVSGVARDPLWSAERLTARHAASAMRMRRGRHRFHPEPALPPNARAMPMDYHGYDRGHMTPAEDVPDPEARSETYSLANVVPQTAALNRGIWLGVEEAVRHLAERDGAVYVVTGPVLAGDDARTWNGAVDIPLATWKAVYDPAAGWAGAYICDNTADPVCTIVSVDKISRVTGVDPFPCLPASVTARRSVMPAPERSHYLRHRRSRPMGETLSDKDN